MKQYLQVTYLGCVLDNTSNKSIEQNKQKLKILYKIYF